MNTALYKSFILPIISLFLLHNPLVAEEQPNSLTLINNGASEYVILLSPQADNTQQAIAKELAEHLQQSTQATLEIKQGNADTTKKEIRLEQVNHHPKVPKNPQGYRIFSEGDDLIIQSHSTRGLLYGIYAFLEQHVGYRWFAPEETLTPQHKTLQVSIKDSSDSPRFSYRDIYAKDTYTQQPWAMRLRLNTGTLDAAHMDQPHTYLPGYSVHTFAKLVPAQTYFETHPEYYGLVKGKRAARLLCLSNPEVFNIALATVKRDIQHTKERPRIVSISQNDCGGYCECQECQRIIAEEGGGTGLLMRFINKMDEALKGEQIIIHSLAYHDTDSPPTKTKPNPDIIIQLCPIGICYGHLPGKCSHSGPEGNIAFDKKLKGWANIHPNLWIWSYHINFSHSLQPFPNIHTLAPYIRYFANNNTQGIFAQSDMGNDSAALSKLRHYIIAQLLWNPQKDEKALIKEFVTHYYKESASEMIEYIALLENLMMARPNVHSWIFDEPNTYMFSNDFIASSKAIFLKALEKAKDTPTTLARIKTEYLSIQYLILSLWTEQDTMHSPEQILDMLDDFEKSLKNYNITHISEHDWEGKTKLNFLATVKNKAQDAINKKTSKTQDTKP